MACRSVLVAILLAASMSGATLIGNLPGTGDNSYLDVYNWSTTGTGNAGAGIQTGAAQLLLEQVTLRLYAYDLFGYGYTPAAPLVGLYSGTDSSIGALIAYLSGPASLASTMQSSQLVTYTPSVPLTLSPNTVYWLLLQGQASSGTRVAWSGSSNQVNTPSSTLGLTHLGYRAGATIPNMTTAANGYYYYEILGSVVNTGGGGTGGGGTGGGGQDPVGGGPDPVPEASTLLLIASGLIAIKFARSSAIAA